MLHQTILEPAIATFTHQKIVTSTLVLESSQLKNHIIIGQGIAGTLLSHELLKAGQKVLVIDNGHKTSSSQMAAGMWNPILFRKLKKSWRADELLPVLQRTYSEIEELLGEKLTYSREIVRQFPNNGNANDFHLANSDETYGRYLSDKKQEEIEAIATNEFGYGTVQHGGYLDLKRLLYLWKNYLISKGVYLEAEFNESDIGFTEEGIEWQGHKADTLIYANGYKSSESHYWSYLPLHRTHGDVLTVELPNIELSRIFNNGQFLLPLENGQFKIGATFDWKKQEPSISEEAKNALLEKLNSGLKNPIELNIVNHEAGIRPTVQDRKPLLGRHPEHSQLAIFNGMGTKGVMLAPFFAKQFVNHLVQGAPIESVVDISRFKSK